jgi:hypothetical protein
MKIGILSDSHDNVPMIECACSIFNDHQVDLVLHAGDYCAPFALNPLNRLLKCDYFGVFGNNDGERLGLSTTSGGRIGTSPAERSIMSSRVLVAHEMPMLDAVVGSGFYRLVVYGHTHTVDVRTVGTTLIVNPGECGGWLFGRPTVAIARLDTLEACIVDL